MSTPLTEDLLPNLLEFIAQQQVQNVRLQEVVVQQQARIVVLENEITHLKKLNTKPNLKPNTKPPEDSNPGTPVSDSGEDDSDDESEGNSGDDRSQIVLPSLKKRLFRLRSSPMVPFVTVRSRILFRSWKLSLRPFDTCSNNG